MRFELHGSPTSSPNQSTLVHAEENLEPGSANGMMVICITQFLGQWSRAYLIDSHQVLMVWRNSAFNRPDANDGSPLYWQHPTYEYRGTWQRQGSEVEFPTVVYGGDIPVKAGEEELWARAVLEHPSRQTAIIINVNGTLRSAWEVLDGTTTIVARG